jgi:hypothetical protein
VLSRISWQGCEKLSSCKLHTKSTSELYLCVFLILALKELISSFLVASWSGAWYLSIVAAARRIIIGCENSVVIFSASSLKASPLSYAESLPCSVVPCLGLFKFLLFFIASSHTSILPFLDSGTDQRVSSE